MGGPTIMHSILVRTLRNINVQEVNRFAVK